jgi:hypothetical protein
MAKWIIIHSNRILKTIENMTIDESDEEFIEDVTNYSDDEIDI